jgi:hypothetical protein
MNLMFKFYTQMEYDGNNMYKFFSNFLNFINSYTQYVHGEPMCTGYVLTCFLFL